MSTLSTGVEKSGRAVLLRYPLSESVQEINPPTTPSVANRLSRLKSTTRPDALDENEIARHVNGIRLADGVIRIDLRYPLETRHGQRDLTPLLSAPLEILGLNSRVNHERLVFIDTETSGLAGGAGTIAFLLGLARIEDNVLHMRQWLLLAFRGEHPMLQDALCWLEKDVCLVSFNGKSFDVPLLTGRYRQNRMSEPFQNLLHLDLVHPLRRAFAGVWEDCRLQTAERHLLQLNRDDDLPGSLMPEIWSRFLRCGQFDALPAALEHNRIDLLSLPALAVALADFYTEPTNDRCNLLGIAERHLAAGRQAHALYLLAMRERHLDAAGLLMLARLQHFSGQDEAALCIWERLAMQGSSIAAERLAKYYEHRKRDYAAALRYAYQIDTTDDESKNRRIARLRGKLLRQDQRLL